MKLDCMSDCVFNIETWSNIYLGRINPRMLGIDFVSKRYNDNYSGMIYNAEFRSPFDRDLNIELTGEAYRSSDYDIACQSMYKKTLEDYAAFSAWRGYA